MNLLLTLFGLFPFVVGNCILPITFGENIQSANCMTILLPGQSCSGRM
jgi:hypothetical protein